MHRLTQALVTALVLTLGIASFAMARPADDSRSAEGVEGLEQSIELGLHMSDSPSGDKSRSLPAGSNTAYAVLDYNNASGEQYMLRIRDLSGISIFSAETPVLNGMGRITRTVVITDFVTSYTQNYELQKTSTMEDIAQVKTACGNVPPVPQVWPPADPNPTDPYSLWLKDTLDKVESSRVSTLEITRTLQAMLSLPDVESVPALNDGLLAGRSKMIEAEMSLDGVQPLLQPQTGRPDPAAGCAMVDMAETQATEGATMISGALAALPSDLSGWSLAETSARFNADNDFLGCLQYSTDIRPIVSGRPSDTPAKSFQWAVGDPGGAAMIFPGPDEVDSASVGTLNISYANGAEAMYAQTVLVPGLNRSAMVSAYVTDDKCIPIESDELTFAVDPAEAGSLEPSAVTLSDGVAETTLTSGDIAARASVNAIVSVEGGEVTGRGQFSVIGPAKSVQFKGIRARELNRCAFRESSRRIPLSVFATDANNQAVADGTDVLVEVVNDPNDPAKPGVLAYDRLKLSDRSVEQVVLGKSANLKSFNGSSVVFPCERGFDCTGNLYLFAGNEPDGRFELKATVDGTSTSELFTIRCSLNIFLPLTVKTHDIQATPRVIMTLQGEEVKAEATPGPAELEN